MISRRRRRRGFASFTIIIINLPKKYFKILNKIIIHVILFKINNVETSREKRERARRDYIELSHIHPITVGLLVFFS